MDAKHIKTNPEDKVEVKLCCACPEDCPTTTHFAPAEVLEFQHNAVQDILKGYENATPGKEDMDLYNELVESALAVPEGCVWRAGGKLILSAFDRNQSVTALTRTLQSHHRQRCANMIMKLVNFTEKKYGAFVTAIQVNFHPYEDSFHMQHRDIYSAKQRGGPNCTCSFRACVGTACYTVGAARTVLTEMMTDEFSPVNA